MTYFSPIVLPTREHSGAGKGGARTGTRPEEDRGLACSLGLRRDGQTGRRASWGRPQSGHRKKRWLMVGPMGGAIGAPGRRAVKNGRGCSEDRCPGHMRGCPRRKSRNGGAGNRRAVDAGTGHATRETMALRRTMPPEIGGPVDPILLCATGLVAGGLLLSAPGPVIAAAAAIACLLVASRRATGLTAAVGVIAIGLGGLRARSAVTLYETERAAAEAALGPPTRCSARARVASSPVRVRGGLRWDAELTRVTCADAGIGWEGRATLYGGPDESRERRPVRRRGHARAASTVLERLYRGPSSFGGASPHCALRRAPRRPCGSPRFQSRRLDSIASAHGCADASTPRFPRMLPRWHELWCSAKVISRPTRTGPFDRADSPICSPSPGCIWSSSWPSR